MVREEGGKNKMSPNKGLVAWAGFGLGVLADGDTPVDIKYISRGYPIWRWDGRL